MAQHHSDHLERDKEFNSVASMAFTERMEREDPGKDETDVNSEDIEKQVPITLSDAGIDSPNEVDRNVVDWDGDDDPENPRNWSRSKKLINIGIISASSLTK
jgi:hypothetical protein